MLILIISTNADEAGSPRHVETVVAGLEERFEFVLVFGENGPVSDRLKLRGHSVFILEEMRNQISPFKDLVALYKLFKLTKSVQPDLIHCHSAKAGMLGRISAFVFRKPWLYTVHGWGWRGLSSFRGSLVRSIEFFLSFIPKGFYIYVAEDVRKDALSILKINPNKGRVIYNGVTSIDFDESPPGDSFTIMMPARVCDAKDHRTLILAFDRLNRIDSRLLLCGAGTDSTEFISAASQLAPKSFSRISFLGQRSDINAIYRHCDVVALISHFEALPLSIIEAMSCGLPVVATSVGGVPEIIDSGVDGVLVAPRAISEISQAFLTLMDPEIRSRFGRNAHTKYSSRFTKQSMLNSIEEVYSSLFVSST